MGPFFTAVLPTATIEGSKEVFLVEEMTLQLECMGTGAPPPDLSWSVDGRSLDLADERVTVMGGSLTISPVNRSDSGTYYCSAMSTAGTVSSSVDVRVFGVGDDVEGEVVGTRGESMLLDCGPGVDRGGQVMWFYQMVELMDSDKYSITNNGSLIVREVDLADMGIYTCLLGDIAINRTLTVVCKCSYSTFRSWDLYINLLFFFQLFLRS